MCKSCRTSKRRPPLHPARPPPSLTHISTAPWDQRKPTYSHIIVYTVSEAHGVVAAWSTLSHSSASATSHVQKLTRRSYYSAQLRFFNHVTLYCTVRPVAKIKILRRFYFTYCFYLLSICAKFQSPRRNPPPPAHWQ